MQPESEQRTDVPETRHHKSLIAILEEIQSEYGYLPREQLAAVAEKSGRSLVDVYGVATFFKAFSLKPRGKHHIQVCLGTACHVRGGPAIAAELQHQLGIGCGHTTSDGVFSLESVNCLGACALGPVVVVDGHYFSNVRSSMVKGIIDKALSGLDAVDVATDRRIFPLEVNCPRCSRSLMDNRHQLDGHPAIRLTISTGRQFGWVLLSSLYGSRTSTCEFDIPAGTISEFYCPLCHGQLTGGSRCPECGTPMFPLMINGGGVLQVCCCRGCGGHILDLGQVSLG